MLETGIKGKIETMVDEHNTAAHYGSGELPVFATPAMIAMMEAAAASSVQPMLENGYSTVGSLIKVKHTAPTPVGMPVRCESELIEIDRRRLVFRVSAYDAAGLIGEGIHERFIIDKTQFMEKAAAKRRN